MRLLLPAKLWFLTLAILTLAIISPTSLAFYVPQLAEQAPEQAVSTKQTENSTPETKKTPASEADKTDTSEPIVNDNAEHDHNHEVVIAPPVDAFVQQQQDIKHYLAQEKIAPLTVADETYLTVINEYSTAVNKGVLVLVPDWQKSIASPNAFNHIRAELPQKGWTTLTLHPPHKPDNYPSSAFTAAERSNENSESLALYGKKLADVMQAVIEQAKTYAGVIVFVVEGNHGALMLDIYQQALLETPSAVVMLSSYMPTQTGNEKLAQHMAASDYPILDLYLQHDHRLVLANAKTRKASAKKAMKVYYRQRQLSNRVSGYYPKNGLTTAIISWLRALGW
ncbi:MAG: DUF3530 family protein [Cognaticolwellia sp.]